MEKRLLKIKPYFRSNEGEDFDALTDFDYIPNWGMIDRTLTIKTILETRFKQLQWNVIYARNAHHGKMELFIEGVNGTNKNETIVVCGEEQPNHRDWGVDKEGFSVCSPDPHLSDVVSYVIKGVCPPRKLLRHFGLSWRKHMEDVSKEAKKL